MSEDADRSDAAERNFATAAVLAMMFLVAAPFAPGILGAVCAVIGGSLAGSAISTALRPHPGYTPPPARRPEPDVACISAEQGQTICLEVDAPAVRSWLERVADSPAARER
jgi:hypothetical protein